MPRDVSDSFRNAFWSQSTGKVPIVLLEINHDTLSLPLRFALNTDRVRKKPIKARLASAWTIHSAANIPVDATEFELTDSSHTLFADGNAVTIELDSGEYHDTSVSSIDAGNSSVIVSSGIPTTTSGERSGEYDGREFAKYYDYLPFPFSVTFPKDEAGVPPTAKLTIDNIDMTIASQIKALSTPPTAKLSIVLADDPDTTEYETPELVWQATHINQFQVTGTLIGPRVMNVSYPMEDFTPSVFPGLFRGTFPE